MSWIYIPPIILIVALVAFLVLLGRKSSELKKVRSAQPPVQEISGANRTSWGMRFKGLGRAILHGLEKILDATKNLFRHTEKVMSNWSAKLQARRNGKNTVAQDPEEIILSKNETPTETDEEIFRQIDESAEISESLRGDMRKIRYVGNEVRVQRRTIEEPIVHLKKEPLPEDKVRESALIYRIAENPKDIEAYREIGDYYLGIGNIKDAKESFKMVLKLRPRDLKAKSSLREIEMRMRLGS